MHSQTCNPSALLGIILAGALPSAAAVASDVKFKANIAYVNDGTVYLMKDQSTRQPIATGGMSANYSAPGSFCFNTREGFYVYTIGTGKAEKVYAGKTYGLAKSPDLKHVLRLEDGLVRCYDSAGKVCGAWSGERFGWINNSRFYLESSPGMRRMLNVVDLAKPAEERLVLNDYADLDISSDGKQIVYVKSTRPARGGWIEPEPNKALFSTFIRVADTDSSNPREIYRTDAIPLSESGGKLQQNRLTDIEQAKLSPDRKTLAFVVSYQDPTKGSPDIFLTQEVEIRLLDMESRQVTTLGNRHPGAATLSWVSDGILAAGLVKMETVVVRKEGDRSLEIILGAAQLFPERLRELGVDLAKLNNDHIRFYDIRTRDFVEVDGHHPHVIK
jgi:hypothetical protein